jgi:hypothetical protein
MEAVILSLLQSEVGRMVEDADEDEDAGVGLETGDCRRLLVVEMGKLTMMWRLARARTHR